jgi:hypothetical protein
LNNFLKIGKSFIQAFKKREVVMETDTLILLGLLIAVLCWFFTLHIKEEREVIKQIVADEQDRLERAERLRRLTNKL